MTFKEAMKIMLAEDVPVMREEKVMVFSSFGTLEIVYPHSLNLEAGLTLSDRRSNDWVRCDDSVVIKGEMSDKTDIINRILGTALEHTTVPSTWAVNVLRDLERERGI